MATTLRYYAEWKQPNREKRRFLRIYDFENTPFGWGFLSSDPQKIVIASGGVNLKYEGRTDNIFEPIKTSSLEVNLIIENDEQAALINAIRDTSEFNLGVTYGYIDPIPTPEGVIDVIHTEWRGVIAPQSVQVDYGINPYGLSFTAVDGLKLLAEYSYRQPDGSEYTDHTTLKKHLSRCFQYLPSLALWSTNEEFYRYMPDLYHENHDTNPSSHGHEQDVLAHTGCNSGVFYQERERDNIFNNLFLTKRKTMSCLDVITDIMTVLQMTLTLSRGSWHMYSHLAYVQDNAYWNNYGRITNKTSALPSGVPASIDGILLPVPDDNAVHQDTEYDILVGSKEGILPPAAGVTYRHINGGSTLVFPRAQTHVIDTNYAATLNFVGPHGNLGDFYPNQSGPMLGGFPKQDDEIEAPSGTGFRMRGTFRMRVRNPFNQSLSDPNDPVSRYDEMIGAKIICSMQIRVGNYYLRQTITQTSETDFTDETNWGLIYINAGAAGTYSGGNRQYYPIAHGDAEWVLDSAARFEFMVLHPEFTSPVVETVEYDDENGIVTTYPVGLYLKREEDTVNKCRYSDATYQEWVGEGPNPIFIDFLDMIDFQNNQINPVIETFIDLQLPALPGAAGDQTGVTIDCSVKGYTAEGFILYDTDVADWPSPSTNYSWLGNVLVGAPAWKEFEFYIGDASREQDTVFSAEDDNPTGTEDLELGATVLGSRYEGALGPMGYLHVGQYDEASGDWLPTGTYARGWQSLHLPQDPDKGILQVCANVGMNFYGEAREQYSLLLKPRPGTTIDRVITPYQVFDFSRENMRLLIQTVTNDLETGEVTLTGVKIEHDPRGITEADTKRNVGLVSGGGMPPLPGGVVRSHRVLNEGRFLGRTLKPEQITKLDFINLNSTSTGVDTITGFSGGGSGLTQEQIDKLLAIVINSNGEITDFTVNGTVLDYTNVTGAAAASTVLANSQQIQGILQKTANITIDQAGNVTQIQTLANAISANSILTFSSKQFISSSDLAQIGTNTTDISSLSTTLGEVTSVIKGSTAGTGKGLYSDTNSATESSVVVNANLISASVETGSSGTETSTTALRITGGTTAGDATVNFDVPTAGISHDDLDNRPPLYHGIGLDAAGTGGFLIGTGSVDFVEGDLLSFTYNNNAGIYQCISATTINRASTAGGVFTNWLTRVNNFTHVGARGDLSLGSLDSSTPSDNFTDSLSTFSLTTTTNITFQAGGAIGLFGTVFSTGTITAAGFSTTGTGSIGTLVASNLNYPTSDGTSGQVLTTDGSGNLSFSTVSAGGSGTVTSVGITAGSGLTVSGSPITTSGSITVGIGSDSVTTAMLQDESVDDNKLADDAVSTDKIANLNVTSAKMSNTGVTAGSYTSADITVDAAGRITAASSGSGGGGGGGYSGPIPLTTISGRWMWSGTDSNERVLTGMSTYGPYNWYSHSTEPSISTIRTYTGTEVVDSTNAIMPAYYHQAFGVQIPTTDKKVRVDFAFRMQNFGSGALIGMSLWGADYPSQGNAGNVTWTLRGESADVTTISTSTIGLYTGSFTTNSIVTEDTLLPMWEHRGGTTLSTTTYLFGQFHVYLVN